MSISSELLTLQNTKTAIGEAIVAKGGTLGETFASYATAIQNLPSGGDDSVLIDLIEGDIISIDIPSGTTGIKAGVFQNCTSLTSVSIPNTVTSIGNNAFSGCSALQSINIPSSVTTLGTQCFSGCGGLTSLTIPDGVTTIPSYMVNYCNNLTEIIVGNNVSTIQSGAFSTSNNNFVLSAIVINTTSVPNLQSTDAFNYTHNCPIYVPAASVDAYKAASGWSSLASRIFAIEDAVTLTPTNGDPAISVKNYELATAGYVQSTDVPSTIKNGAGSLEISEGVTRIGQFAFQSGSSLTSVTIPSTITRIDSAAFDSCSSLTSVTINATTPPTLYALAFNKTNNCPIYVPAASVDTYKAASNWSDYSSRIYGITTVAYVDDVAVTNADLGITGSSNITISSLSNMPSGDVLEFTDSVSKTRTTLTGYDEIILPSTFTEFDTFGAIFGSDVITVTCNATTPPATPTVYQFGGAGLTHIYVPGASLADYQAARGWASKASIIFAIAQVATVDGTPVYNYEIGVGDIATLTSTQIAALPSGDAIEIAEGVQHIQGQLGAYEQVTMPSTLSDFSVAQPINSATLTLTIKAPTAPSVQSDDLGGSGLTAIYIPAGAAPSYQLPPSSAWSSFASIITTYNEVMATLTLSDTTTVDITKNSGIAASDVSAYSSTLVGVEIKKACTSIATRAFRNFANLATVTFESGRTYSLDVGSQAFSGCTSIASISIPSGGTIDEFNTGNTIKGNAFQGCTSLENVTIGDNLAEIYGSAFADCSALETVTIGASTNSLGQMLGQSMFSGCDSLVSVTINDSEYPQSSDDPFDGCDASGIMLYVPSDAVTDWNDWLMNDVGTGADVTVAAIPSA